MTGRQLIIYILKNNLEDKEMFKDGKFFDLPTVEEYAAKREVGVATVYTWVKLGLLDHIRFCDTIYILP